MTINISTGKESYSQRNNELKPFESCNVTSMCMALDYLNYKFPNGKYKQPEDNLRAFMESKKLEPTMHAQLSAGVNEWLGQTVTTFSTETPMSKIFHEIKIGHPVVMSGTFPGYPTVKEKPLGHILVLVGLCWTGPLFKNDPAFVLVDDPYGDTMNDWKGKGDDIQIPWNLFLKWMKPLDNKDVKWTHTFVSPKLKTRIKTFS